MIRDHTIWWDVTNKHTHLVIMVDYRITSSRRQTLISK